MFSRILAASALALGLASSAAMAHSTANDARKMNAPPSTSMDEQVDTGTTGSIYPNGMGMTSTMGPAGNGEMGPCASAPGSMGPDANASPGPNDHYCGK